MPDEKNSALLFRAIAALGVVLAFFLTLVVPQHMRESTDWSFYYTTRNFAAARLTEDGGTISLQASEAAQFGGTLGQYVVIGDGKWALTEAPGYIFYLIPFYFIHAPELGNFVLAACMALVVYLLLKRLKGERVACLGSQLIIFTPVALAMMQRAYADSFGATAFLSMGGGLYLYVRLSRTQLTPGRKNLLMLLSGLGLGMAVASNYFNALVAGVFLLHTAYSFARESVEGRIRESLPALLWLLLGLGVPLAGLMLYQAAVFGSPWSIGLTYAQLPVGFAGRFWLSNIKYVTVALLVGFPLLLPALAALLTAARRRVALPGRQRVTTGDSLPELPGDLLLLLACWIAAVYGLYFFYEWTASAQLIGMPVITLSRYYLPAALPIVVLGALWLERVPRKLAVVVATFALAWGVAFFAQAALSYAVVPPHSPYNPLAGALAPGDGRALLLGADTRLSVAETSHE
jgi:hypothetical protein